jgi:hypothetical protein
MPFLIDGSNLGGVLSGPAGARDRAFVVRSLLPWARKRGRVVVVFDGPEDPALASHYGPLELHFSKGESADRVILRLIGSRATDWHVVTSDAELAAECRHRGATTLGARAFRTRLEEASGSTAVPEPGSAAEPAVDLEEWQEFFRRGGEGSDER